LENHRASDEVSFAASSGACKVCEVIASHSSLINEKAFFEMFFTDRMTFASATDGCATVLSSSDKGENAAGNTENGEKYL
jgi:hypothetical protein